MGFSERDRVFGDAVVERDDLEIAEERPDDGIGLDEAPARTSVQVTMLIALPS